MLRRTYPWLTGALRVGRLAMPARFRMRMRQWMFEWLDLSWQTRSQVALRVAHYREWIIYNEVFVNGDYDHALALALDGASEQGPRLQIVDVGANVGFFTLRAVDRLLDRGIRLESVAITAFEANETFVREYQGRVLDGNRLARCVRLVHGVVGERSGTATFYHDSVHGKPGEAAVQVPYVDLSSALAGAPRIDLLKCDIEGMEQRLIENYPDVLQKTRVAVFELHRDLCDAARCQALLREYGFTGMAVMRENTPYSLCTVWRERCR